MRSLILLTMLGTVPFSAAMAQSNGAHLEVPGATIQIEFQATVEEHTAQALIEWLDHVADQVSMTYGRFPVPAPRVVIIPANQRRSGSDSPVPFGRVTRQKDGETVELYVDIDRPIADFYADWTASHEFSHLLLPRVSWRQKWISEGFASYYQNVLMARAGHYTGDKAVRMLSEGFERGRASRPELSANEAAEEGVREARYKIYWSGAAIALLADLRLRERSGGEESLDTVLGKFQQCCLPSTRAWSGPQFFRKLDSLIDEPVFMPLYQHYAAMPGFPDTGKALSSPILREQILRVRTYPN